WRAARETVDMQRRLGEPGTKRADHLLQPMIELLRRRSDLLAPGPRLLGLGGERREIDSEQLVILDDHASAYHDGMHRRAVLDMDQGVHWIVGRDPVDVLEIEEDDVGLVARSETADLLFQAERAGTALGGRPQHLFGGDPALVVGALDLGA